MVPPRQAEFLQVPINAAKAWLSGSDEVDVADVTQELVSHHSQDMPEKGGSSWARWEGFDKGAKPVALRDIRPGDILIVDPSRGGIRAGTWDPSSIEPVTDLGDAAQIEYGRRATLRLDSKLIDIILPATPGDEDVADRSARDRILEWLDQWSETSFDQPGWLLKTIIRLRETDFDINAVGLGEESTSGSYYILSQRYPETRKPVVDAATMDGSDEAGSLIETGVTLSRHMDGVGKRAGQIAERLNLPAGIVGRPTLGWMAP